jgi:hypothetical protein
MEMGQNLGPARLWGLLHIVKGYAIHINSIEMSVRVQYTNLSSFYCIGAHAWGNLTHNLTCLMLLYNTTNIAFSLAIQHNSITQEYTQGIYKCIHGV